MQYALIKKTGKKIPLELRGFGKPYKELHEQTDTDGYSAFLLESHNGFNNIFARMSQTHHDKMGYWAELFADMIREGGRGTNDKGELDIVYVLNPETNKEKEQKLWAPENGFYYPTNNGFFHEGTLIPHATTQNRDNAIKLFAEYGIKKMGLSKREANDLAKEQVSYFYRLNSYRSDERFVGRDFDPGLRTYGRFDVAADWRPSRSGDDGVASRPKVTGKDIEYVMEI